MLEYAALVGIDWPDAKHDVCLLDCASGKREPSALSHTPKELDRWADGLRGRYPGQKLAVCLEQSRGPLVYALLKYDFLVLYPINPKTPAKFREAFTTSRAKDDPSDAAYLAEMERQDAAEASTAKLSDEELRAKIKQLRGRKQFHEDLAAELQQSGAQEVSLTDPDSSLMSAGQGLDVCYNVQTAVDGKHKLIVHHEVTNAHTDEGHLVAMAATAKQVIGGETLEVMADKGYYSGEEIKRCEEQGIVTYIPKARVSPKSKKQLFTKDDFRYDPLSDTYTCPEGARLTHRFTTPEKNGIKQRYYRATACKTCVARPGCTENNRGRTIKRLMDEDVLERMAERLRGHPEKMRQRGQLVEHPFGTMKRGMNQGYFLPRGLKKVAAEMSLTVLCYNLKRALKIVGVDKLLGAVT